MSAAPDPLARRARVRVGVGAALVLALGALGVGALVTAATPHGATSIVAPGPSAEPGAPQASATAVVYVHILGEVRVPGLYELREGDRAIDALAAAGGYTDAADRAALNLARPLVDGEQIVVPVVGAAPAAGTTGSTGGRVNLNTATAEELETLPRVGPATAARIIAWREANGRFSSVEDLLAVSGIGEKTLAGFADLVTV